ncbi:MAG: ABC transporter permease [Phycisphaerales bacterium]|nr:ABC transporter permease [Phycisphaerales bacterium]
MSDFAIVLRSLRTRKVSSGITIAMVAVAVALLLTLLSLRESAQQSFRRGTGNAHLLVSGDASPLVAVLNGIFHLNAPRMSIPMTKIEEIKSKFPWAYAIPTQLGDSFRGFPVVASNPQYLEKFEPVAGEPWGFLTGRGPAGALEVALGSEVARSTGLGVGDRLHLTHGSPGGREPVVRVVTGPQFPGMPGEDEPGDESTNFPGMDEGPVAPEIEIHAELAPHVHDEFAFEVVGVLKPTGSHHDRTVVADLRGAWLVHAVDRREAAGRPLPTGVEDLEDGDRLVTGLLLQTPTRPGRGVSVSVQQAFDMLRRDPELTVASPSNQIDRLFQIVSGVDAIFVAMAVAVLCSTAIGVLLALWNSMDMRRRQIAILRVLGASRGRVLGLVLGESVMMGLAGAVLGTVLCVLGGRVAAAALESRTGVHIVPELDLATILVVVAFTVVLSAVAGLGPAMKAYRTSVAEHLRPLG